MYNPIRPGEPVIIAIKYVLHPCTAMLVGMFKYVCKDKAQHQ